MSITLNDISLVCCGSEKTAIDVMQLMEQVDLDELYSLLHQGLFRTKMEMMIRRCADRITQRQIVYPNTAEKDNGNDAD